MIKTVSLTADTETKVEISGGYNVGVINRTTGMLYASRKSGIVAGADDVAAIPAGDSYVIRAADDTVYLLATAAGDVQLESIGAKEVFKVAAARSSSGGGEGGTVDEVARQAIASHANNGEIHLTAEKAIEAAATAISNPNLLINTDFKINQRGQSEYTSSGYTVDMWEIIGNNVSSVVCENGLQVIVTGSDVAFLRQKSEHKGLDGNIVTLSVSVNDNIFTGTIHVPSVIQTGSSNVSTPIGIWYLYKPSLDVPWEVTLKIEAESNCIINWAKLEFGDLATPFTPPDPATELVKCQRHYQIRTTGDIDPVDLRPSMATIKDIKERSDGNYEYIAEA